MSRDNTVVMSCAQLLKQYCSEYSGKECIGCIFAPNKLGCRDVESLRMRFRTEGKYPFEWGLEGEEYEMQ